MDTWHIHIKGQVQGVGFRPFIYSVAQEFEVNGWVNNTIDGVHIVFNADEKTALTFRERILEEAPRLSKITALHLTKIKSKPFSRFEIIHSELSGEPKLLLTPDFALCQDCKRELHSVENHRYLYPFISCTNCGPRFSIIHDLPYDRGNTKMDIFQMCPRCQSEYGNPSDRRYYSQTNSCPDCSIKLTLYDAEQNIVATDHMVIANHVVKSWEAGKIVAIKGIGGYLLTCDAANRSAVEALRKKKHRPSKPFALMYPSSGELKDFFVKKEMVADLEGPISPIVLLDKKESASVIPEVAPGLSQIGVMLPYTPLFDLLLTKFGHPIVATSGNHSHSPIVYQDHKALEDLLGIADFVLGNNREIVIPQDDSLIKYSFFEKQKIILRRSRGLAPTYINASLTFLEQGVLAMGAMLKSTFSLSLGGNIYISQYLGDLTHFDTQQNYELVIRHFLQLFQSEPLQILSDKHPQYPSSQLAEQYANTWNIPPRRIQHHIAHFGAILGEHSLVHTDYPVLGVIWDGTGLGDDNQIWGGEFFTYQAYNFTRNYHFDYFDFILGDKMAIEPRVSALSACWAVEGATELLRDKFTDIEWRIYTKLLAKENALQTSSIGRIFDAVASLLGILDQQTYEGEAAMRLEAVALDYCQQHGLDFSEHYLVADLKSLVISTSSLMSGILADLKIGKTKRFIAAKFHYSLVEVVRMVANSLGIKQLAFSGGVFQNALLVDLLQYHLKGEFELFFHRELSPNDENISFGQIICYQIEQIKEETERS